MICVAVMLISLIGRLANRELPLWFTESYGFVYGILLFDAYGRFKAWANRRWLLKTLMVMILGVVFGMAYIKVKPVDFWGDYCMKIVLGVTLISLILLVTRRFAIGNPISRFLGAISYEVYLIHSISFRLLSLASPGLDSGTYVVLSLALSIALAAGVHKVSGAFLSYARKLLMKKEN